MGALTDRPDKIFVRTGDLINPPRYWVIGDSHSLFFAGLESITANAVQAAPPHEGYRVYYVGPGLASSLIKPASRNRTQEKVMLALNDIRDTGGPRRILFSFGEIDCRFHIRLRAQKAGEDNEEGWQKSAQRTAESYLSFLRDVKNMGFEPVIWGPPPSTPNAAAVHDFITLGTPHERNALTRLFSQYLKAGAARDGFGFVSLFEALVTGNEAREGFSKDAIHIAQNHWPLWLAEAEKMG